MKVVSSILLLVMGLILAGFCCGCGNKTATTSVVTPNASGSPVQNYADPATETTLRGLSENDYDKYLLNCSPEMKAALTKDAFEKSSAQIKAKYGDVVSCTFLSTENKDNYVIVHYSVKYTLGTLKVRMVFDQNQKIAGQWFE
jgi:hypothetical protein